MIYWSRLNKEDCFQCMVLHQSSQRLLLELRFEVEHIVLHVWLKAPKLIDLRGQEKSGSADCHMRC